VRKLFNLLFSNIFVIEVDGGSRPPQPPPHQVGPCMWSLDDLGVAGRLSRRLSSVTVVLIAAVDARGIIDGRVHVLLRVVAARRRVDCSTATAETLGREREERVDRLDWFDSSWPTEDAAEQQTEDDDHDEQRNTKPDSKANYYFFVAFCQQTQT